MHRNLNTYRTTAQDIVELVAGEQASGREIEGRLRAQYQRTGASFTETEIAADVEMEKLRLRCFEHRRDVYPEYVSAEDPIEHFGSIMVPGDETAAATLAEAMNLKEGLALDVLALGHPSASDMVVGKALQPDGRGKRRRGR